MNIIITLILVLISANLLTSLGSKIKVPRVVSLILCGLLLDIPSIRSVLIAQNTAFLLSIGDIALICLMFMAGLESSWRIMYKERKDAVFIAVFAFLFPFLLGFAVFRMMGFSLLVSSIVGISMSITAEATKARVLLDLKKLRTKVGSAMMGAGIIDDILGLSLFILVTYLLKVAYLKEDILIAGAIISFFIGILVQKNIGRKHIVVHKLEKAFLCFIIPFFFVSVGLNFDINSLVLNQGILLLVLIIAVAGKLIGTFLTKPFTRFSWKQLHLIGWSMNSRGAVEMALALIAFRSSLIPVEIYSSLVIMALITTLIFPFIIIAMVKKDPKIMG
ncbi:cation:proton antiporter [Candidatus Woesearchaeota archaeon]|nr:cation:proton antiporter [Candidatus Woesearchaeota archaeon]